MMGKQRAKDSRKPSDKLATKAIVQAPLKGDDKRVRSDFPKFALREAIQVAEAIELENGGNAIPPTDLAIVLKKGPGSSIFRDLLSASIKYGLTSGSFNQPRVEIKEHGTRIAAPKNHEDKQQAIVEASLNPPTFRSIYEHFRGKKLPEPQFFENAIVREFSVPREHAAGCVSVFLDNVEFAGLVRVATTGRWLAADAKPRTLEERAASDGGEVSRVENDVDVIEELRELPAKDPGNGIAPPAITQHADDPRSKRVFITHGKNQSLVAHLKELLKFGQFEPVVSVDRESVSKPVPDKVMDDMRSCGAAIIHIDAERELITQDGQREIVLNSNVLIEIGAAMALYGRRFILLKQKDVRLPSNLQGLYEVRYEGEKLDVDSAIKLMKAFNDFKSHKSPEE